MAIVLQIEGAMELGGDLTVEDALHNVSGTVTFAGTPTLTVKGNLTNSASWTSNGAETVVLNGQSGTQAITSGGCQFNELQLNGADAVAYDSQDAMIVGTLQLTRGTLDFGGYAAQVMTLNVPGGETTIALIGGSGTVTWKGDVDFTNLTSFIHDDGTFVFAQVGGTQTINSGGYAFGSVQFSGSATYSLGAALECIDLQLQSGALSIGSYDVTASGNAVYSGGTVAPASGRTKMIGTSATINDVGAVNIGHLQVGT